VFSNPLIQAAAKRQLLAAWHPPAPCSDHFTPQRVQGKSCAWRVSAGATGNVQQTQKRFVRCWRSQQPSTGNKHTRSRAETSCCDMAD